jgi:sulfite exporter TauE/SafE/plastocyanin
MNLFLIFLTGLTTGGLACLAVQGGLLASVISNQKEAEEHTKNTSSHRKIEETKPNTSNWQPVTVFLVAKLIIHTLLGALLGLLGSAIALNLETRLFFQFVAAAFMFATAMNLLNVHPIFRYVVLQPPKFIQRLIHNTSKSTALFAPAFLGLMTVLIPCGVTQAMELVAINSGSPLLGASIMFAFVLGTSPIFALVGLATAKFSDLWNQRFLQFTAIVLIFMSLFSINGILTVIDFPITGQKIWQGIVSIGEPPSWYGKAGTLSVLATQERGVQKIVINVNNRGYNPTKFAVKAGIPVELTLKTDKVYSCATSFTFKKFNIFEQLQPTDSKTVTFTPTEKGVFTYACSMGMYQGQMEVL